MATRYSWNRSHSHFYCLYSGFSMFPTLREPDILQVVPYRARPMRVGDVIFFRLSIGDESLIVHRIIDITPQGIRTQGENTPFPDPWLISPEQVLGQIVIAWRGQKARKIFGGWKGRVMRALIHQKWYLWYASIKRFRVIPWRKQLIRSLGALLSKFWSPRVILFQTNGTYYARLLFGKCIIGRYSSHQEIWHISYPFRFFVDSRNLPAPSAKATL